MNPSYVATGVADTFDGTITTRVLQNQKRLLEVKERERGQRDGRSQFNHSSDRRTIAVVRCKGIEYYEMVKKDRD
jgi:hypothetical protein